MPPTRGLFVLGLTAVLWTCGGWGFFPAKSTPQTAVISAVAHRQDTHAALVTAPSPDLVAVFEPERFDELISAREVAQRDPDAVIAWAADLADTTAGQETLALLCFDLAKTDPVKAIATATALLPEKTFPVVLSALAGQWAQKDFNAALAWAARQASGDLREQLLTHVIRIHATTAPGETLRLLNLNLAPGSLKESALISVLITWAQTNRTAATQWVASQLASPQREHVQASLQQIEDMRTASE